MNLLRDFSLTKNEFLIGLVILVFVAGFTFGSRQMRLSDHDAISTSTPIEVKLHENIGLDELIHVLENNSIEFDSSELKWSARLLGWRTFRRGSYLLDGDLSYQSFLRKLALGNQDPVSVVVLPGITQHRFSASVARALAIDSSQVDTLFYDEEFLEELGLTKEEVFGRMLPETYSMYWTSTGKEVIRRILKEFDHKVAEPLAEEADSQNKTIEDVLIMASIVEWEAKLEREKPVIAGLYWNRIKKRMRLEADPTVNFAIGERRRLLFEDYRFDHPYNTYLSYGLPPGPITNPSLSTIKATLNPDDHGYLYMVANPEGGHTFTRTFEEHQQASEEWRRWLRKQYRIARERESQ